MGKILETKNIKNILDPVSEELSELNDRLVNRISPDSSFLCGILQDIFSSGGKRLRPAISFLVCKSCLSRNDIPEDLREKIFLVAEIDELIHTASLIHDDIIDNALIRRSIPTTNSKWNNAITVISGDFLFARAAVNLGKLNCNEVVCLYASVLENLCDGEIEQAENKFNLEIGEAYYFKKSYKKTASLFEASAKSVAALLDLDAVSKEALASYGRHLGIAFQIIDDILDYTSDEIRLGKEVGSDLKEGQITLPLIYALEEFKTEDTDTFNDLHSQIQSLSTKHNLSDSDRSLTIKKILQTVRSSSGIEKSENKARDHVNKAVACVDFLESSQYKTALIDLAHFVISREN